MTHTPTHSPTHSPTRTPAPGLRFPDLTLYRGYAAPSRIEANVYDLEVDGAIPAGLNGTYYRAAADPQYPPLHGTDIFINGDGMIHMVRIADGHADLTTRYVRTDKLVAERAARRALFGAYRNPFTDDPSVAGMNRGTANTSVVWHGGKLLALKEAERPMRLDPDTLETLGYWDFDGALGAHTFTAHPKIDHRTGEMIAFSYNCDGVASPTIEVHWIDASGSLNRTERFDAPYPSMVHDFHVSEHYIAFTICPMVNDWERVERGEPFFHWDSELPTSVAVIPRGEGVAAMRWFAHPTPVLQTHTFNAWDSEGVLHLDHFITRSGWLSQFPDIRDPEAHEQPPFPQRWTIDLRDAAAEIRVGQIFGHIGEMPVIDHRWAGRRNRHFWFGTIDTAFGPMLDWGPKGPPFTCLGHYDEIDDAVSLWYAGTDSSPEEPYFVPAAPDAPEGDGWLLSVVGRRAEHRTDVVILDARDLPAGPIATIRLPFRIHEGFHGTWLAAR